MKTNQHEQWIFIQSFQDKTGETDMILERGTERKNHIGFTGKGNQNGQD